MPARAWNFIQPERKASAGPMLATMAIRSCRLSEGRGGSLSREPKTGEDFNRRLEGLLARPQHCEPGLQATWRTDGREGRTGSWDAVSHLGLLYQVGVMLLLHLGKEVLEAPKTRQSERYIEEM